MSLRAAALVLWRRSNLNIAEGIASGEEQEHPRNDIVLLGSEGTYIFTNPKYKICIEQLLMSRSRKPRWL